MRTQWLCCRTDAKPMVGAVILLVGVRHLWSQPAGSQQRETHRVNTRSVARSHTTNAIAQMHTTSIHRSSNGTNALAGRQQWVVNQGRRGGRNRGCCSRQPACPPWAPPTLGHKLFCNGITEAACAAAAASAQHQHKRSTFEAPDLKVATRGQLHSGMQQCPDW